MIQELLAAAGIRWGGDWATLGAFDAPAMGRLPGKQAERLARIRLNLAQAVQRVRRQRRAFPENVLAPAWGIAAPEPLPLPEDQAGRIALPAMLDELGRREWTYLLVEGGPRVLESFTTAGLADEFEIYVSPQAVGETSLELPRFDLGELRAQLPLRVVDESTFGEDRFLRLRCASMPAS